MTYVVDENCIKCKHMDCVDVCPVDCFYEGENMLVIHPDECIDCGVCEPECPIDAIHSDTEDGMEKWAEINRKYSEIWPVITEKKFHLLMPKIGKVLKINLKIILVKNQEVKYGKKKFNLKLEKLLFIQNMGLVK